MSQARLTNLAIQSIERHLTETINFDAVIQEFAEKGTQNTFLGTQNEFVLISFN